MWGIKHTDQLLWVITIQESQLENHIPDELTVTFWISVVLAGNRYPE